MAPLRGEIETGVDRLESFVCMSLVGELESSLDVNGVVGTGETSREADSKVSSSSSLSGLKFELSLSSVWSAAVVAGKPPGTSVSGVSSRSPLD